MQKLTTSFRSKIVVAGGGDFFLVSKLNIFLQNWKVIRFRTSFEKYKFLTDLF